MSRALTDLLIQQMGAQGTFIRDDHGGMEPLSAVKSTLVLLWTLANQDTIRSIADRFDLTKSSVIRSNVNVIKCQRRLTSVLVGPLMPNYIKWPNNDVAADLMDDTGTIKIVGAIDGRTFLSPSQSVIKRAMCAGRDSTRSSFKQFARQT